MRLVLANSTLKKKRVKSGLKRDNGLIQSENKRVYIASMFICLSRHTLQRFCIMLGCCSSYRMGDRGHKQEKVISLPRTNQSRSPLRANWKHFDTRHHHYAVTSRTRTESPIGVFMCARRKRENKKGSRKIILPGR